MFAATNAEPVENTSSDWRYLFKGETWLPEVDCRVPREASGDVLKAKIP